MVTLVLFGWLAGWIVCFVYVCLFAVVVVIGCVNCGCLRVICGVWLFIVVFCYLCLGCTVCFCLVWLVVLRCYSLCFIVVLLCGVCLLALCYLGVMVAIAWRLVGLLCFGVRFVDDCGCLLYVSGVWQLRLRFGLSLGVGFVGLMVVVVCELLFWLGVCVLLFFVIGIVVTC